MIGCYRLGRPPQALLRRARFDHDMPAADLLQVLEEVSEHRRAAKAQLA